ncbi:hypothetical protein [Butyrivibrio sp. LC3010]|uniref:hypothetical protein n=1 Tax=Butyrivibrio sp. LC3010 TaxID=1280680 RepID=UPI00040F7F43|nr:hypothetical protein [Butyrivibrio sp. LC3010]
MKKWENADINFIELSSTEEHWLGKMWDGGYIGDGHISGHATNDPKESVIPAIPLTPAKPTPHPVDPVNPDDSRTDVLS